MDLQKFSTFKYLHDGASDVSPQRWRVVKVAAVLALLITLAEFPMGIAAFLVPLIIYFAVPRRLYIGPRYLICGEALVYFNNVSRLALDPVAGTLTLNWSGKRSLVIARDKFPTNARKAHKIATNKALKFDKVAAKIIEKVRHSAPDAELKGIAPDGQPA